MNKLFLAASAAALLAAGTVPSLAQSSSSSGASAVPMPSISCKDLSAMDQQTARNVVFYLSGLHAASGSTAMNSTTGSGSSSTSADAGSSGSTTGTTGSFSISYPAMALTCL